jgi:Ion channel
MAALTRFWADDRGLSVFSALLFVVVFLLPPLLRQGSGRRLAGDVVYALLLLSGVLALGGRGLGRIVPMAVAVVAVAVSLGSWVWPVPEAWVQGTNVVSLLLFLVVVLTQTLRAGPVTFHRIQGAIAAYVLLGMIWAYAYALLALLRPGAFSGPINPADGPRAWFYFSFVTLTTVGYGDVLPVHPVARSLAILEAVTGPLYLAILVARLVSLTAAPAGSAGTGAQGGGRPD